MKGIERKR